MHRTYSGPIFISIVMAFAVGQLANAAELPPLVGDAAVGQQKIAVCATCHAEDGNSIIPANPSLAGQHQIYLMDELTKFKSGERNNPIMAGMAAGLSPQDIADISAYYASQTPTVGSADPSLVKHGEALYRGGDLARGIPACMACHGPTGAGNGPAKFPALAGQNPDYIIATLKEYQSGVRTNAIMQDVAVKLTDADMKSVASYIYGLYPTGMVLPAPVAPATPAATTASAAPAVATTPAATPTTPPAAATAATK